MVRTRTSTLGAASRFRTGTYAGDGAATQAIVGVGFRPKCVIIYYKVNLNDQWSPFYGADVDAGFAWGTKMVGGSTRYLNDFIVSLDVDGFTVGDNVPPFDWGPNQGGRDYTYIAFG